MRIRFLTLTLLALTACSPLASRTVPPSTELGTPRGYRIARVITHLHSPYSWDACDSNGVQVDGSLNATCLQDLRDALCTDQIDFAFLTDHPSHMAENDFQHLLLYDASKGDQLLTDGGQTAVNQMGCSGATNTPLVMAGFEDRLMPLGMDQHLDPSVSVRETLYYNEDSATVTSLKGVGAVVAVPHTESRSLATLESLGVDAIEVYNLHANIDPKIRHASLGLDYFGGTMDLLVYWLDPYHKEDPDFAFLDFFEVAPIYASLWDQMLTDGYKVTGIAGTDSHENAFPYTAHDGERLDSHRRVLHWFSNHVLTTALDAASIKAALKAGRSWIVFSAFGDPVGMDFSADAGGTTVGVGETGAYLANSTTIHVPLPTFHVDTPQQGKGATVTIRLYQVANGADTQVATSTGTALDYTVPAAGIFRAEVFVTPTYLSPYLGFKKNELIHEYPWIITNPIYLQ